MRVRFWGVRGTVPWATPAAIGHGCNTPCVEIANEQQGTILVLDAGSGIVGLGEELSGRPQMVPILLSHYHWDHIQGVPFFAPLYRAGWSTTIWGPSIEATPSALIETLFQPPFFPVPSSQLLSRPAVRLITTAEVAIHGFRIRAVLLNHPGGAFAYRIAGTHGDLVYATDHELGDERFDGPLRDLAAGAQALVLDAHFTPAEGPQHRGWGHSTWAEAAAFAASAEVKRLYLFHHKPGRTDAELARIEAEAREIFPATHAAVEGDVFDV